MPYSSEEKKLWILDLIEKHNEAARTYVCKYSEETGEEITSSATPGEEIPLETVQCFEMRKPYTVQIMSGTHAVIWANMGGGRYTYRWFTGQGAIVHSQCDSFRKRMGSEVPLGRWGR